MDNIVEEDRRMADLNWSMEMRITPTPHPDVGCDHGDRNDSNYHLPSFHDLFLWDSQYTIRAMGIKTNTHFHCMGGVDASGDGGPGVAVEGGVTESAEWVSLAEVRVISSR